LASIALAQICTVASGTRVAVSRDNFTEATGSGAGGPDTESPLHPSIRIASEAVFSERRIENY
jgi:hypothetical protein